MTSEEDWAKATAGLDMATAEATCAAVLRTGHHAKGERCWVCGNKPDVFPAGGDHATPVEQPLPSIPTDPRDIEAMLDSYWTYVDLLHQADPSAENYFARLVADNSLCLCDDCMDDLLTVSKDGNDRVSLIEHGLLILLSGFEDETDRYHLLSAACPCGACRDPRHVISRAITRTY